MPFDKTLILSEQKNIDVLLVGELLVDIIYDPQTQKSVELFGGSPANIALNLNRLGFHSKLYSSVGSDSYGTFLLNKLNELDIDYVISRDFLPTSLVKIIKTASSPTPEFIRNADKRIFYSPTLEKDIENANFIHFSYWPVSENPARETILKVLQKAKECNTIIGFDPNYHPLLDNITSDGLHFLKKVIKEVDIIKPSLDDSIRIFGDNLSLEDYLSKYQELGCKLIIMTLGEKGLIARYENESIVLPSYAKEIVDSTGAGDAFWSGLYAGLSSQHSILKSIELGLECSAYNLKVVGADANLPNYKILLNNIEGR